MFYHIIMKNFKSNLKNYILFFVSNILAIAELFAFWGLNDVVKKAVKDGVTAATLKSDFVLAAGLITFITVFLMIFSMKYYMKLRIKDYTTFIVLGMKKKTSYLLLLVEYTVGCVFSLVFGILMGRMMLETINNMMLELYASMAQAELEKKEKRQREGIEAKKLRGEWDDYGRPSVMKQETFDENFQSVVSGETTPTQLRKNLGMTHSTFYRYRKTFYEKYPELSNSAN